MNAEARARLREHQITLSCGYCGAKPGDRCRWVIRSQATKEGAPLTEWGKGEGPERAVPHRLRGL